MGQKTPKNAKIVTRYVAKEIYWKSTCQRTAVSRSMNAPSVLKLVLEHMLNPKSYEHEANPQTNVKFVEKSVANDKKHTEEMHEEFRKSCTICEETFTISSINNHKWRVHETQINTCETCQYQYGRVHPNFPVGETKTESFKKKSKKKAVEDEKANKPAANANK